MHYLCSGMVQHCVRFRHLPNPDPGPVSRFGSAFDRNLAALGHPDLVNYNIYGGILCSYFMLNDRRGKSGPIHALEEFIHFTSINMGKFRSGFGSGSKNLHRTPKLNAASGSANGRTLNLNLVFNSVRFRFFTQLRFNLILDPSKYETLARQQVHNAKFIRVPASRTHAPSDFSQIRLFTAQAHSDNCTLAGPFVEPLTTAWPVDTPAKKIGTRKNCLNARQRAWAHVSRVKSTR
ncbi:hypothetical protein C8F04DRAFT_1191373 [Mycena alexandri]|uniref:Uncharacterized protein n=1 Tax=Mycena alexandri TaxID=1745969 RepID=A0AAD6SD15_9AGAR|nr:hypothetical protein C8F04DRAFT_1191373 [Mycena alexandri]